VSDGNTSGTFARVEGNAPRLARFDVEVVVPPVPIVVRRRPSRPLAPPPADWTPPWPTGRPTSPPVPAPPLDFPWPDFEEPEPARPAPSPRVASGPYLGPCWSSPAIDAAREFLLPLVRGGAVRAPVLPHTLRRGLEIATDPDGSFCALAEVVSGDAGVATTLLRYANSFGAPEPATGVREALVRVGMSGAREALMIASSGSMVRVPGRRRLTNRLQTRSRAVASAACAIVTVSSRPGLPTEDAALTAGVVHDIGRSTLHTLLRKHQRRLPDAVKSTLRWDDVVDALHGELGWELAAHWGLDLDLAAAIGHHHAPDTAPGEGRCARLVAAACAFADHLGFVRERACPRPMDHPDVIPLRLDSVQVAEVARRVRVRMERAGAIG